MERVRPEMTDQWRYHDKDSRFRIPLIPVLSMTRLIQKGADCIPMYSVDLLKSSLTLTDMSMMYEMADISQIRFQIVCYIRKIEFRIELRSDIDCMLDSVQNDTK